jgi:transcriptional regulator with XRE-family HTH domain
MTDIIKTVGDRVRLYRQKAGLSQFELGEMAGLHNTYIGHVERGVKKVSIEALDKIIKALGLSYEVFYANICCEGDKARSVASECYNLILKMDDENQRAVLEIIRGIDGMIKR